MTINSLKNKSFKIGLVGATGVVGQCFLDVLKEEKVSLSELRLFASDLSVGKTTEFNGQSLALLKLEEGCFKGLDLVFFSAGEDISRRWAPQAVSEGAFAVDNSSAFRMDPEVALVVPEVNGDLLDRMKERPQLIANPNCSTIQLVVALKPLMDDFGIERVTVASYQAVSGAGLPALNEFRQQVKARAQGESVKAEVFPYEIAFNPIPQIGSFDDQGFSSEEMKIMKETKKILGQTQMKVSAFTVRVPVENVHSECVWVELKSQPDRSQVLKSLKKQIGLQVSDSLNTGDYPVATAISGKNEVYLGRLHQDLDSPQQWIFWVVADNLRKGAAYNGFQIAQRLFDIT